MQTPTHDLVRREYARIAATKGASCCGDAGADSRALAEQIGYTEDQLAAIPDGANLGLGCGNPTAIAALAPGQTVIDLGSGAGFDALLAARAVGPSGHVIGIDMTPEMVARARENATRAGLAGRLEFREGLIEALPVADHTADVVLSNCVINLSPDKAQVFREAYRVLRPGGRLAVSDIVLTAPLPEAVAENEQAYVGCIAGAMLANDYLALIAAAGFTAIRWARQAAGNPIAGCGCGTEEGVAAEEPTMWSYTIEAQKP